MKSGQALALSASDADRVLRTVLAQAEIRFTISSGKPGSADAGVAVSGARIHAGAAVLTGALAQARVDGSSLEELKMKINIQVFIALSRSTGVNPSEEIMSSKKTKLV